MATTTTTRATPTAVSRAGHRDVLVLLRIDVPFPLRPLTVGGPGHGVAPGSLSTDSEGRSASNRAARRRSGTRTMGRISTRIVKAGLPGRAGSSGHQQHPDPRGLRASRADPARRPRRRRQDVAPHRSHLSRSRQGQGRTPLARRRRGPHAGRRARPATGAQRLPDPRRWPLDPPGRLPQPTAAVRTGPGEPTEGSAPDPGRRVGVAQPVGRERALRGRPEPSSWPSATFSPAEQARQSHRVVCEPARGGRSERSGGGSPPTRGKNDQGPPEVGPRHLRIWVIVAVPRVGFEPTLAEV